MLEPQRAKNIDTVHCFVPILACRSRSPSPMHAWRSSLVWVSSEPIGKTGSLRLHSRLVVNYVIGPFVEPRCHPWSFRFELLKNRHLVKFLHMRLVRALQPSLHKLQLLAAVRDRGSAYSLGLLVRLRHGCVLYATGVYTEAPTFSEPPHLKSSTTSPKTGL